MTLPGTASERHRPEIDGLRAAAILAVVLCNYGVPGFAGGYAGIDVFFVISGYLATAVLCRKMSDGTFSFAQFYAGRVRRIVPALCAMLAATALVSVVLLTPGDLKHFGESLLAAATFTSNILAWRGHYYFDPAVQGLPLFHTWPLGLLAQFLLLYPLLVFLLRKARGTTFVAVLALVFAVSFALNVIGTAWKPGPTFFLLPTRAWEFLLGVAPLLFPAIRSKFVATLLAIAGLGSILFAVFTFSEFTQFPGFPALIPCLGAALVIYAGSGGPSPAATVLGSPGPAALGRLSYSLYLWHWPVYVLANYFAFDGLNPAARVGLLALSLVLAWLSYRFVERRSKPRRTLIVAGFAAAVLASGGLAIFLCKGLPQRFDSRVAAFETWGRWSAWQDRCFNADPDRVAAGDLCQMGDKHAPVTFLLWGDSHANAIAPGLSDAAAAAGVAGLNATRSRCTPLIGVERYDLGRPIGCREFDNAVVELLRKRPDITEVVLAGRWSRDALGVAYGTTDVGDIWLADDATKTHSPEETKQAFARGIERTLRLLTGLKKKIVLVGPVPESHWAIPATLAKEAVVHSGPDVRPTVAEFQHRQAFVLHLFAGLRKKYPMTMLSPSSVLCGTERCAVERDGRPFYIDDHHMSDFGARQLTPLLAGAFR